MKVDRKWLPINLYKTDWFSITDRTALAVGDWVFDGTPSAMYAGQILAIRDDGLIIHWYKSEGNEFPSFEGWKKVNHLQWDDPVMQGAPNS